MPIRFAGWDDAATLLAEENDTTLEVLTFQAFLEGAQAAPVDDEGLWVWSYRAPWTLFSGNGAQGDFSNTLMNWQTEQRTVLRLRRRLDKRLLLINRDRVSAAQLCARLGLPEPQEEEQPEPAGLSPVVASLFESMAPGYWDVFEALEAAAWLPEGEPQFRYTLPSPNEDDLLLLLQTLQGGLAQPALRTALTESEREAQRLADENTHLQAQLQQAREALDKQTRDSEEQIATLAAEHIDSLKQQEQKQVETSRQLEHIKAALAQTEKELDGSRQIVSEAKGKSQALLEENDLLLAQLHQVQEELEKYYLESKALKEQQTTQQRQHAQQEAELRKQLELDSNKLQQQLADARKQLEQAKGKLHQQSRELEGSRKATTQADEARKTLNGENAHLQKQLADMRKQLEQAKGKVQQQGSELESSRQAMSKAKEETQALTEENELLLAQLHQVQEELERYYLANREFQAVMGQSQASLHRARSVVSRLVSNG